MKLIFTGLNNAHLPKKIPFRIGISLDVVAFFLVKHVLQSIILRNKEKDLVDVNICTFCLCVCARVCVYLSIVFLDVVGPIKNQGCADNLNTAR